ncbi:MAG: cupin domain-containing protein [Candidatus Woesearchaeota archaeon]
MIRGKKWKNVMYLIQYSDNGIMSKQIIKEEKMEVTLFSMSEGTNISEHTSTKQGAVYVIEGDGIFNLEGEEIKMVPGVIINMNKNAVHLIKADENTTFLLILNK